MGVIQQKLVDSPEKWMFQFDFDDIADNLMMGTTIIHVKKRFSAIFFLILSFYISFTFACADRSLVNSTNQLKTTCEHMDEFSIENSINDRHIVPFI